MFCNFKFAQSCKAAGQYTTVARNCMHVRSIQPAVHDRDETNVVKLSYTA